MRILFFDTETTGLSRERNKFINISAIVYNEDTGLIEDIYDTYVNPGSPIPYQITQLTGITTKMVEHAPYEGIAVQEFMEWARKQNCDAVAGQNILKFDIPWMDAKCKAYTVKYTLPETRIDTLNLAKQVYDNGCMPGYNYTTAKGNISFKQEFLMDYYKCGVQTHTSLDDVRGCIMIYRKLKEAESQIDYGF